MSRTLALLVSLSASLMVHGAARAQSSGEACVGTAALAQSVLQTDWGWLQWALMVLCLVLFVVAYALIFWVTARHGRRSPQAKWWRDSRLADVLWTLLPLLMVIALLWPMFKPMLLAQPSAQTESHALILRSNDVPHSAAAKADPANCPPTQVVQ